MNSMFACGFSFTPVQEVLVYATLVLWLAAALAVLINFIAAIKAPNARRPLEFSLWFCFLVVGAVGWYPLTLMTSPGIPSWLSYIYGAPALVLGHSVRLNVLARREKALTAAKEVTPEITTPIPNIL